MENAHLGLRLVALALLTAANAFFSAAEVALLSVSRARIVILDKHKVRGAAAALYLIDNMERMISLCQVGITLASLGMGWAGEEAIYHGLIGFLQPYLTTPQLELAFRAVAFVTSFLLLTLVLVVIGEVVPKNLAVEKAERMAVLTAPPLLFTLKALNPFVFVIERSSAVVSRWFGLRGITHGGGHSAEEIKHIVSSSSQHGYVRAFEESAIHRLLDLGSLVAREVMVPRDRIVSLPVESSLDDVVRLMAEQIYSRLPVYRDKPENIVGYVHVRDLLRVWRDRRFANARKRTARAFDLEDWMRKPIVVPETKPLNELVDEFRTEHTHMAVVVDEFGTVAGILTMEDVLEQVFGEIEDEHDVRRLAPRQEAAFIDVEGITPILDLEKQYGLELPQDDDFETLAGFLLSRLGVIPKGGEQVLEGGRRYTVLAMDRNRIAQVRIERLPDSASSATETAPVPAP